VKRVGLTLVTAWVFFFATVAILFAFPKPTLAVFGRHYFHLFPIVLLLASVLCGIACIYRAGMKRGAGSPG
jgi:predicted permease